ncbi:thermonuclease family protein [Capnocytophaga canimorsus]|nr:thermonuclease family protein [Capnocytophaga canimorsus]GIM56794.1 hypothetical protein CAPN006_11870 [Capnocytophaga canimorsus]
MHFIYSLLVAFLLFSCSKQEEVAQIQKKYDFSVKVIRISDGDSFVGLNDAQQQMRLRIHGIDAPESGQPYGKKAKQKLSEFIFGKQIYLKVLDTDRYGRKIVKIQTNHISDVGLEMIKSGLAWHYIKYDNSHQYSQAQDNARNLELGLWHDASPTPPWQWRSQKHKSSAKKVFLR